MLLKRFMINLNNQKIFYDPYPHALFMDVFNEKFYKDLCNEFPENENFDKFDLDKQNLLKQKKFVLNDKNRSFKSILRKSKSLNLLYNHLVSQKFKIEIMRLLEEKNILFPNHEKNESFFLKIRKKIKNIKNFGFELSMISSDGGFIKPHTDGPDKLISFVIPIVEDDNFSKIENSGTKILIPIDEQYKYNYVNKTVPFEATQTVREIPFSKNQIFLFLKTHNSLHSVGPMKQINSKNLMRKSINFFIYKN